MQARQLYSRGCATPQPYLRFMIAKDKR
ncbi:hypothetical protein ID866_12281 [Astraeus odoratus]|nr:hypothetical protein ID866_12281 [Astraeus odoratus]